MSEVQIVSTVQRQLSSWVTLQERTIVRKPGSTPEIYHSFSQADYVTVLAVTSEGLVPMVRQFRPAIQGFSLELPGGMVETNELPLLTAERELFEETGFKLVRPMVELGVLTPDTGRLENRFYGYFAGDVIPDPDWREEIGVEQSLMKLDEFKLAVRDGGFDHALHIALVGLALLGGLI
jgi:8-oxo-dGTP pyrophosphatase MutT (NUDIX family)